MHTLLSQNELLILLSNINSYKKNQLYCQISNIIEKKGCRIYNIVLILKLKFLQLLIFCNKYYNSTSL